MQGKTEIRAQEKRCKGLRVQNNGRRSYRQARISRNRKRSLHPQSGPRRQLCQTLPLAQNWQLNVHDYGLLQWDGLGRFAESQEDADTGRNCKNPKLSRYWRKSYVEVKYYPSRYQTC